MEGGNRGRNRLIEFKITTPDRWCEGRSVLGGGTRGKSLHQRGAKLPKIHSILAFQERRGIRNVRLSGGSHWGRGQDHTQDPGQVTGPGRSMCSENWKRPSANSSQKGGLALAVTLTSALEKQSHFTEVYKRCEDISEVELTSVHRSRKCFYTTISYIWLNDFLLFLFLNLRDSESI